MAESNGLYYMRARFYDPAVKRFISEDPLGFDGGDLNLYAYVGNNPIMGVDPLGLCAESWGSTIWNTTKYSAEFMYDFTGGMSDFGINYYDMREANTIGADKYFHAKANYEAASRGPGGEYFAEHFSNAREIWDQRVKGYPRSDSLADQAANAYGRSQAGVAPNGQTAAAPYRPNGLDPKY